MEPFDHSPENDVQRQQWVSRPGESPDQNQAKPQNRPFSSENTEIWMRWEYTPHEWALFERIDWRPVNLRFWLLASLSLLLTPDIGVLIWSSDSGQYSLLALSIVLIIAWTLVITVFTFYIYIYDEARKRHRSRQRQEKAHTVTFDRQGLWEAGAYFPLNDRPFYLEKAHMTYAPPVLHFSRIRYVGGRTTPKPNTLHIPVPDGHEQEAAELLQRFYTEVIQTQEKTQQRLTDRPEPD